MNDPNDPLNVSVVKLRVEILKRSFLLQRRLEKLREKVRQTRKDQDLIWTALEFEDLIARIEAAIKFLRDRERSGLPEGRRRGIVRDFFDIFRLLDQYLDS